MKSVKDLIDELFSTDDKKFECPECGKEFKNRAALKAHARQAHRDIVYTKVSGKDRRVKVIKRKKDKDKLDLPPEVKNTKEVKEVDTA